jgi:hypothetical protein
MTDGAILLEKAPQGIVMNLQGGMLQHSGTAMTLDNTNSITIEALAKPLNDGLLPWVGGVQRGLNGHRIASPAFVSCLGVPQSLGEPGLRPCGVRRPAAAVPFDSQLPSHRVVSAQHGE